MKRNISIEEVLKPLHSAVTQAYLSNVVQMADILEWILGQVGRAKVWQTSFSISEEFIRRLYFINKKADISEFNLVLDHKATNKTLTLWSFISQVISKTYLADNHSKVLLVESESGLGVTVITSQNLTRGNRHESTVITTDKDIFEKMKSDVISLIRDKSVPLMELLEQRIS